MSNMNKKSKRFKFPRGEFLINDQFGNPIHRHDVIYHKNNKKGYVDYVWVDGDTVDHETYFYLVSGDNWNFVNISARPFES